jgi:hypothetical protein
MNRSDDHRPASSFRLAAPCQSAALSDCPRFEPRNEFVIAGDQHRVHASARLLHAAAPLSRRSASIPVCRRAATPTSNDIRFRF